MKLVLADGLRTAQGGAQLHDPSNKDADSVEGTAFQIKSIDSSIVRNKEGDRNKS